MDECPTLFGYYKMLRNKGIELEGGKWRAKVATEAIATFILALLVVFGVGIETFYQYRAIATVWSLAILVALWFVLHGWAMIQSPYEVHRDQLNEIQKYKSRIPPSELSIVEIRQYVTKLCTLLRGSDHLPDNIDRFLDRIEDFYYIVFHETPMIRHTTNPDAGASQFFLAVASQFEGSLAMLRHGMDESKWTLVPERLLAIENELERRAST